MAANYDARLFDRVAQVEDRSFWFQQRNRLIENTLRRLYPDARSFLEVGCGTGVVLRHLAVARPDLRLTGLEPLPSGAVLARARVTSAEIRCATAQETEGAWDVVGGFDVLEHVEDDTGLLREFARLAPAVIVTVPQHPRLTSEADTKAGHLRRYRRRELLDRMRAAGLEPVLATSFVTLLTPAAFVARSGGDPLRGLLPPWPLNRLFGLTVAAERLLIGTGVRLPFGQSLLVAARRR